MVVHLGVMKSRTVGWFLTSASSVAGLECCPDVVTVTEIPMMNVASVVETVSLTAIVTVTVPRWTAMEYAVEALSSTVPVSAEAHQSWTSAAHVVGKAFHLVIATATDMCSIATECGAFVHSSASSCRQCHCCHHPSKTTLSFCQLYD